MPRFSGLDLIKTIRKPPLVIITTAYSEYALEGYELEVIDYLIKPIAFDRLLKACFRAREFYALKRNTGIPGLTPQPYFFIKCNGKHEKINFSELLFVEAADNYVVIHTEGKKFMAHLTLKSMEKLLSQKNFMKVHKSFIVALDKIMLIEGHEIDLKGVHIPISRKLKAALLDRIGQNKQKG